MTTFYVASSRDGLEDVLRVTSELERHGYHNTFPWPRHFEHTCLLALCGIDDRRGLAYAELVAAGTCDLFVGIGRLGQGSHVELGAALYSSRPRIILVGVNRAESVFYDAGRVEHVADLAELFTRLSLR
jgi:hypothetical protein